MQSSPFEVFLSFERGQGTFKSDTQRMTLYKIKYNKNQKRNQKFKHCEMPQALRLPVCNRETLGPIFWAGDTARVTKLLLVFLNQCRQILEQYLMAQDRVLPNNL